MGIDLIKTLYAYVKFLIKNKVEEYLKETVNINLQILYVYTLTRTHLLSHTINKSKIKFNKFGCSFNATPA